ncbi:hypothetical protein NPX13_g652 [Xylaria arbuscula]|uniref:Uncharacterized protein n=1 Tax=Xylaria arbuscula TaxID=114810 RepID=A0A9W8NNW9_9PEZI|nr:hypothetical protein NPX13_g652 [Xylaria arbuscula]
MAPRHARYHQPTFVTPFAPSQFVHNEWIESYDPTIEDSYRTQVTVDQRQVVLEIMDTAGTDQFGWFRHTVISSDREPINAGLVAMRDLYMKTGQGFLLVFSITSESSLSEIAGLREEIIRIKDDHNVPMVICGNKADLEEHRSVSKPRGFEISRRWNAPYYETSARTKTNVEEVFIDLCRQMLRKYDTGGDMGGYRHDEYEPQSHHRRRRRRREHHHRPKCVIL